MKINKLVISLTTTFALLVGSQSAFAATVYDKEPNDYHDAAQFLGYGDLAMGKISSENDHDWFYFQAGANDGGRTMTLHLQSPANTKYLFVINKNYGEPVPVTVLSQGSGNPEWVSFTLEANARYNFVVFKSSFSGYDPNNYYYLSPWLY
ncbi:hypothetical protein ACFFK0_20105 [Paenibacillus chartarius]|uniref:Uncharacterized protein n=1 Tax=Paenibacillus chartarius TaxID=747481 RepID=A0ABV6DPZ6_9BACL